MNYAKLAFTDAVKSLQEVQGSRKSYEKVEKYGVVDGLSENETAFISDRDSFYMATIGENGYPYIQHRGGPRGFVKVIGPKTIGFVDFTGNKQYISVGNIATHPQVSMIMVSYPHRSRLKIYANARIVALDGNRDLFNLLDPTEYQHRPERIVVLDIQAFDWNCPQHITPRYTTEEIELAFGPQRDYIEKLEEEIKALKMEGRIDINGYGV